MRILNAIIIPLLFVQVLFSQDTVIVKKESGNSDSLKLKLKEKEHTPRDVSDNRMMLAPTGRTMQQGEVQFASMIIIPYAAFPIVHVGVTDFINLGVGFSIPYSAFYFAPKVRVVKTDLLSASIGLLYVPSNVGIVYGAVTIDGDIGAFNFGAGYSFSKYYLSKAPLITAGGELRLGPWCKLMSENWFFTESSPPALSLGFRLFSETVSADLMGVFVPSKTSPFFYPLLTLAYTFNVKNALENGKNRHRF